jgi:WD40 repeat protein
MWRIPTLTLVSSIVAYGNVWSLSQVNNLLFAGVQFTSFVKFNTENGTIIEYVKGSSITVYCLTVFKDSLFVGSDDALIRTWSIKSAELFLTMQG